MNLIKSTLIIAPAAILFMACGGKQTQQADADTQSQPPLQHTQYGNINRHYIYSPEMGDTITIDVWTSEGFDASASGRYPVIVMHDGQNLYDATTTWNQQAWEVDSVASALIAAGEISAPVIIGVHSVAETRKGDLMPEKAFDYISVEADSALNDFKGAYPLRGSAYAKFIATTLRDALTAEYNLTTNPDSTFVMGSSMGGLMSVYALTEYPEVFGAAACLSTHWIGTVDGDPTFANAMYTYLAENLPRDGRHRLYLDHGTETLDSLYIEASPRFAHLADSLGYTTPATDSIGRMRFEYYVDKGGAHEERSWAARVDRPLRFLLGKSK